MAFRNMVDCPDEIISGVVILLGFDDICSLRLTCKYLATKCSQPHFQAYFRSKHAEMTMRDLQTLAEGTQAGGLRSLVQDMTLTGIANFGERKPAESHATSKRERTKLLELAFDGLATNSTNGRIHSLSLGVSVAPNSEEIASSVSALSLEEGVTAPVHTRRLAPAKASGFTERKRVWNPDAEKFEITLCGGWKRVWKSAAETFDTALRALAATNLEIESLNIFNDSNQQSCSLAADYLSRIDWKNPNLVRTFSRLRSLSISLSNRIFDSSAKQGVPEDHHGVQEEAENDVNFVGLAWLFELIEYLEYFELHYFVVRSGLSGIASYPHEKLLQHVGDLDRLPTITRCRLRGIITREADLLAVIKRIRVRELTLETITLRTGTFQSLFDHCTSETASITKLYFDALYEPPRSIIHFDGRTQRRLPLTDRRPGSEYLKREGDEVARPISYHIASGGPIGSPITNAWYANQHKEYGPL